LILAVVETGESAKQLSHGTNILYKHKDALRASEDGGPLAVAVVGVGALGDGNDELALGVGGGGHGGARAGREAEAPPVELEGRGPVVVGAAAAGGAAGGEVPDDDLGDPRVDLDGVRAGARGGEAVDGGGDEPQRGRVLLDGDVRVGRERELQHLGKDVRQAAQLLPAERARGGRAALHGDGALPRRRVDPHGVAGPRREAGEDGGGEP